MLRTGILIIISACIIKRTQVVQRTGHAKLRGGVLQVRRHMSGNSNDN